MKNNALVLYLTFLGFTMVFEQSYGSKFTKETIILARWSRFKPTSN